MDTSEVNLIVIKNNLSNSQFLQVRMNIASIEKSTDVFVHQNFFLQSFPKHVRWFLVLEDHINSILGIIALGLTLHGVSKYLQQGIPISHFSLECVLIHEQKGLEKKEIMNMFEHQQPDNGPV